MSQVVPLGKINQAYAVLATTNGRDKVGYPSLIYRPDLMSRSTDSSSICPG